MRTFYGSLNLIKFEKNIFYVQLFLQNIIELAPICKCIEN